MNILSRLNPQVELIKEAMNQLAKKKVEFENNVRQGFSPEGMAAERARMNTPEYRQEMMTMAMGLTGGVGKVGSILGKPGIQQGMQRIMDYDDALESVITGKGEINRVLKNTDTVWDMIRRQATPQEISRAKNKVETLANLIAPRIKNEEEGLLNKARYLRGEMGRFAGSMPSGFRKINLK